MHQVIRKKLMFGSRGIQEGGRNSPLTAQDQNEQTGTGRGEVIVERDGNPRQLPQVPTSFIFSYYFSMLSTNKWNSWRHSNMRLLVTSIDFCLLLMSHPRKPWNCSSSFEIWGDEVLIDNTHELLRQRPLIYKRDSNFAHRFLHREWVTTPFRRRWRASHSRWRPRPSVYRVY